MKLKSLSQNAGFHSDFTASQFLWLRGSFFYACAFLFNISWENEKLDPRVLGSPLNFITDLENLGSLKGSLEPHRSLVTSISDKSKPFFSL